MEPKLEKFKFMYRSPMVFGIKPYSLDLRDRIVEECGYVYKQKLKRSNSTVAATPKGARLGDGFQRPHQIPQVRRSNAGIGGRIQTNKALLLVDFMVENAN